MNEEWKEYSFNGVIYKVSNKGNIFSLASNKNIKQRLNKDGYKVVTLGGMGKRRAVRVHRLVALLFVPKPSSKEELEVNHIDCNRTNNNSDNLEWVTHKENVRHSYDLGRYTWKSGKDNPNYGNHKLREKYKKNPELAKLNNSRKGIINGRSKKVSLFDSNNNYIADFGYIGECCEYIKATLNLTTEIDTIRNNLVLRSKKNKTYRGYYIKFI